MEQNPSLVARWLAAGDAGDVEAFDDILHRDVVVHAPRGLSTEDLDSEKQVWRDAVAAIPDLDHPVQEVVTQGDVEVARVIVTGRSATISPVWQEQAEAFVWIRP